MSPKRLNLPKLPQKAYLLPERKIGTCTVEVERPLNWKIYEYQIEFAKNKYESGNFLSLYDAIALCRASETPLPDWLSDALQEFFVSAIKGDLIGESGAYNSIIGRISKNTTKGVQAYTVWCIQNFQKDQGELAHVLLTPPAMGALYNGKLDGFRYTTPDSYEMASIALRGTFAQGSPGVMETAFKNHRDKSPNVGFYETNCAFGLDWTKGEKVSEMPASVARWRKIADAKTKEARGKSGRKKKTGG
jgi:hypothetical protein